MHYELTDHFEVSAAPDCCWAFFGSAENLPKITPPWLRFTIAMPAPLPAIAQDTQLDYTIRWMGAAVRWRTRIAEWSPPNRFTDLQVRGPYALWRHEHVFEPAANGGGVVCRDRVVYRLPFPLLGRLVHAAVVRRQLLEIFRFRRKVIGEHLGWVRAIQQDVIIRPLGSQLD